VASHLAQYGAWHVLAARQVAELQASVERLKRTRARASA